MSVEELDRIVELTLEDTQLVYGSHLSGGGFGGCVATLLHKDAVASTKERILVSLLLPLLPSLPLEYIHHAIFFLQPYRKDTDLEMVRRPLLWYATPVVVLE